MNKNRHTLKMSIITAFAGLFVFLVMVIIGFNTFFGHRASMETSEQLFEKVGQTAIHKTVDFLQPAIQNSRMFERIIDQGHVNVNSIPEIQDYCFQTLKVYPQFNGCFYATQWGMWGAEVQSEGIYNLESRHREKLSDRLAKMKDIWVDAKGQKIKEKEFEAGYDPRVRPWYILVKKELKPVWSEPYLFYNADKVEIGVSATVPIFDEEKNFAGATLTDITMDALALFLKGLKVSEHSMAFIIDQNGQVVCFPDLTEAVSEESGEKRLKNIVEMTEYKHFISAYAEHCKSGKKRIFVDAEGGKQIVQFIDFPNSFGKQWKMVLSARESDFTETLNQANLYSIFFSMLVLAISTFMISIIARNISKPIHGLTSQLNKIRDLNLREEFRVDSRIEEICEISNSIEALRIGLQAFKKYVPEGLVKDLVETGETARIGGKNEILTVFFSDIQDFTRISEGLPPEYLGSHLSEYLDELTRIIQSNSGTIDKYIGDAIMAFWGAPHKDLNHESHACAAALRCQMKLQELSEKWDKERKPIFHTRMGIHTGPTVVGNMGSMERMNYTVIGDSVNLASRLEGVNKVYGTNIIISEATATRIDGQFVLRPLDTVQVKGKSEPIKIFELMDFLEGGDESKLQLSKAHEEAYLKYLSMDFEGAIKILQSIQKDFPGDGPSALLMKRCQDLVKDSPDPKTWSGIRAGLRFGDIKP